MGPKMGWGTKTESFRCRKQYGHEKPKLEWGTKNQVLKVSEAIWT